MTKKDREKIHQGKVHREEVLDHLTKKDQEKVLNRLRAAQHVDPHSFGIWVAAASRRGDWQTLALAAKALEPQKETVALRLRRAYAKLFLERRGKSVITKSDVRHEAGGLPRPQCARAFREAGLDWLPEGGHGRPKKS